MRGGGEGGSKGWEGKGGVGDRELGWGRGAGGGVGGGLGGGVGGVRCVPGELVEDVCEVAVLVLGGHEGVLLHERPHGLLEMKKTIR